jgi:hypothetical protein
MDMDECGWMWMKWWRWWRSFEGGGCMEMCEWDRGEKD